MVYILLENKKPIVVGKAFIEVYECSMAKLVQARTTSEENRIVPLQHKTTSG